MHPRLAELDDLLTRQRAALLAAVAEVPADHLDTPPAAGQWSVGQLLEHLRLVEDGSARLLARRLARAREQGLGEETETSSVAESLDRRWLMDGEARTAPEMVTPAPAVRAAEALAGLAESRAALQQVMRDGDGLALGQVRATHAALGDIDFYQWLQFIAWHEARHARQLHAIAAALAGSAARAG